MKAAVLEGGELTVKDIPKPEPKNEEAVIKMVSAGVCHSDLHQARGDWPKFTSPHATVLGHEGIGIVEEIGPGADRFVQVGDRVIMGLGGMSGYWCGACEACLSGKTNKCRQTKMITGTYAEYIGLWAKTLVKLPDEVGDNEVPLACAGLTTYSAIRKFQTYGVLPGKPIAIVGGAGGLGHYAIQIAKTFGYTVVAVDVGQDRIDFMKEIGADHAVDASEARQFVKQNFIGTYGSVVFAPKIAAFELGLNLMRNSGVFIAVAMPSAEEGDLCIDPLRMFVKDPLIMYSAVGNVDEMRNVVQLSAEGKLKTHVSRTGNLSEINQIFDEMERGEYLGRAILTDFAN